jgi:hypothetical protein
MRMTHRPTHDAAQNITATFVAGQNAISQRKLVERKWSAITRWLARVSPSAFTPVSDRWPDEP